MTNPDKASGHTKPVSPFEPLKFWAHLPMTQDSKRKACVRHLL